MSTLAHVTDQLQSDLSQFRAEVTVTNATLVRPTWQAHTHPFSATLWAYVMSGFSKLDLYSKLWDGGATSDQTPRMRTFLARYLPRDPLADSLAIQLWRHTLMHTSRPRRLRDSRTGREFSYLLHWGAPELLRDDHYRISGGNKLDFGLEYFIEDLGTLLAGYLADLTKLPELQAKALATWPKIENSRVQNVKGGSFAGRGDVLFSARGEDHEHRGRNLADVTVL